MALDKKVSDDALGAFQKVAGYDVHNLTNNNIFITSKSKIKDLSFKILDIVETDDYEILKLQLNNGLQVRLSKFNDADGLPSSTFDIVNEEKKEIVVKTDKTFVSGVGIAESFFNMNLIVQWEVPILIKLCRGFILGDKETIRGLLKDYNLKIVRSNEWKIKDILEIDK